jgi:hypothetical protein
VRDVVTARDNGSCLRCSAPGTNVHHRIGRGMGGTSRRDVNDLAALVTLCGSGTTGCHGWVTEHPAEAYALGWAIRRSETTHPSEIPLTDLYGRRFFLTEEGALVYLNGQPL